MEHLRESEDGNSPRTEIRMSFFTRKFSHKVKQQGKGIPSSVMVFLDTPICSFNEDQKTFYEEKFCPMIPSVVSVLTEIYEEVGADRDGWEDMITYSCKTDTPMKICAREALDRKDNERAKRDNFDVGVEQSTGQTQPPPHFHKNKSKRVLI
jgi:hypothetical protein